MSKSIFFITYLATFLTCLLLTVAIILMIGKGLKKFFESISPDPEISGFFTKITQCVLFLGGISTCIAANYKTDENSNWLTLTWDAAGQVKESLQQLFITLLILSIVFFILTVAGKRINS